MRVVFESIRKAARVPLPVLIVGETGTGKEMVAHEIHSRSDRRDKRFLPVHMGSLPTELVVSELFGHRKGAFTGASEDKAGCFEDARGGTMFLDEIATMTPAVQVSLLRVLETGRYRAVGATREREADVRIVAATNIDLREAAAQGLFREDLRHRLQVLRINLPPLRMIREEIPSLAKQFLADFCEEFKFDAMHFSDEAMDTLMRFPWPGNIRELRNAVAQAAVTADHGTIEQHHLPPRITDPEGEKADSFIAPATSLPAEAGNNLAISPMPAIGPEGHAHEGDGIHLPAALTLDEVERRYVLETLERCANNKTRAAKMLGVSRKALYDKLGRWKESESTP